MFINSRFLGLILDVHKVENGISWFRINHSDSYKAQQYLFTTMRKNLDYEGIMASDAIAPLTPYF
jgi:hypothetical protein